MKIIMKTVLCVICASIILSSSGCVMSKLRNIDYDSSGNIKRDTRVSYNRLFNQKLKGMEIVNELFTAKMADQNADNTEVVKAGAEGLGKGIATIGGL